MGEGGGGEGGAKFTVRCLGGTGRISISDGEIDHPKFGREYQNGFSSAFLMVKIQVKNFLTLTLPFVTSHVTRQTSHLTRHTSHFTPPPPSHASVSSAHLPLPIFSFTPPYPPLLSMITSCSGVSVLPTCFPFRHQVLAWHWHFSRLQMQHQCLFHTFFLRLVTCDV